MSAISPIAVRSLARQRFSTSRGCLLLLFAALFASTAEAKDDMIPASAFAGYYASGPFRFTYIDHFEGHLAVQPPGWSSRPNLARRDEATFYQSLPSRDTKRVVAFARFAQGRPQEMTITGFGKLHDGVRFQRVHPGDEPAGLLALTGQSSAAAFKATRASTIGIDDVADFALRSLGSLPTKAPEMLAFITDYLRLQSTPITPRLQMARGYARLMTGDRAGALLDFNAVLAADPGNDAAREYSALLTVSEPPAGQGYRALLPFALGDLYAPPMASEMAMVLEDWQLRDLHPGEVEVIDRSSLDCGDTSYAVQILKHESRGHAHYGALLIPKRSRGKLASIIDVRGVNPDFSPMTLDECTTLLRTLGDDAARLAVLIPAMNGHEIQLHGRSYKSGGDPSDSWDGGTDAVLTFLNAALSTERRLDNRKIAIHGHSRGGGVAMLAAIRDKRISLVLSRSGPVDWFQAMHPVDRISWAETLRLALIDGKPPPPRTRSSQHYDTHIDRVVTDGESLSQTRHRMIASSAYYFAERLPETHAFYGREDPAVVPLNAKMLALRLGVAGHLQRGSSVEVYDGVGHDTDWYRSSVVISRALKKWLGR